MAAEQYQISEEIRSTLAQLGLSPEYYRDFFVPMGITTAANIRAAVQGEEQAELERINAQIARVTMTQSAGRVGAGAAASATAHSNNRVDLTFEERERRRDAQMAEERKIATETLQEQKRREEREEQARQKAATRARLQGIADRKVTLTSAVPDDQPIVGFNRRRWGRDETTMGVPNLTVTQTNLNLKARYGVRLQAEAAEQARLQQQYNSQYLHAYHMGYRAVPDAPLWQEMIQFLKDYEDKQADEYRRTHIASWTEETGVNYNYGGKSIVVTELDSFYGGHSYRNIPLYEFCRDHRNATMDTRGRRVLTIKDHKGRNINILLDDYYRHHVPTTGETDSNGKPVKVSEDLIIKYLAGTNDSRLTRIPLEVVKSAEYYDKSYNYREYLLAWYLAARDPSEDIVKLHFKNWDTLSAADKAKAVATSVADRTQLFIDALQDNWRSHNIGDGFGDDNGKGASHACDKGFHRGFGSKFYGSHPSNVFVAEPNYVVLMFELAREIVEREFVKASMPVQELLAKIARDERNELVLSREEETMKEGFYTGVKNAIKVEVQTRFGAALNEDTQEARDIKKAVDKAVEDNLAVIEDIPSPVEKFARAKGISSSPEIAAMHAQKQPPMSLDKFKQCVFDVIYKDTLNRPKEIEDGLASRIDQGFEYAKLIVTILGKTIEGHFTEFFTMQADTQRADMLRNMRAEIQRVTDANVYANNYIALLAGVISPAAITTIRTPLYYRYYGASADERRAISRTIREDIENAKAYAAAKRAVDVSKTAEERIMEYLSVPLVRDREAMLAAIKAETSGIERANVYADDFMKALKQSIAEIPTFGNTLLQEQSTIATLSEIRTSLYYRFYANFGKDNQVTRLLTLNLRKDVGNAVEYAKLGASMDGRKIERVSEYLKATDQERDIMLNKVHADVKLITEANVYADSFMQQAKTLDPSVKPEIRTTVFYAYCGGTQLRRQQLQRDVNLDVAQAKTVNWNWQPPKNL